MHRITSVVEATTRVLQLAMADMSGIVRMSETHKNGTTFRPQQPTNRSRGNDKDKAPRNEPPQRAIDIVIIISRTTLLIRARAAACLNPLFHTETQHQTLLLVPFKN